MTSSDPLPRFTSLVDRFEQTQNFIDQAHAKADRFRPEVIARVVEGHKRTIDDLLVDILPLLDDVEGAAATADQQRAEIEEGGVSSRLMLEELELRNLIGEIENDTWEAERAPHADRIAAVDSDLAAVDARIAELRDALLRWELVGQQAGLLQA